MERFNNALKKPWVLVIIGLIVGYGFSFFGDADNLQKIRALALNTPIAAQIFTQETPTELSQKSQKTQEYEEPQDYREPANFADAPKVAYAQDVYSGNPIAKIVKKSSPAVVNIDTESMLRQTASPFPFADDPIFKEFFGNMKPQQRAQPVKGKGSGFIVSKEGYILTNNHVVQDAQKINVTLEDGRMLEAKIIGTDPTFDLAVIKINASNLPALPLGNSDAIDVGEWVITIGNPYGFEQTVTVGVVSAKNRTVSAPELNFQGFIQTDAAINPGNSGGPMLNLNGEVIGINTAIVPYAQGIGFAVPVNMAKQVMDDLINHGAVKRGWLGVTLQTITPAFAQNYGVPTQEGAIIADIMPGSPADRAGLARGDVIIAADGKKVKNSQDVVFAVRKKLAGDKMTLEYYQGSVKKTVQVTLSGIPVSG